jgi:hypothetical protein
MHKDCPPSLFHLSWARDNQKISKRKRNREIYQYLQQNPEWKDDTGSVPLPPLSPILDPNSTPVTFYASLTPPIAHELCTSPVIELVVLAFPSTLNFPEKKQFERGPDQFSIHLAQPGWREACIILLHGLAR